MPLTLNDTVTLSAKAVALSKTIATALDSDGEGGKKVTRAELSAIMKATLELLAQLVVDIVD